MHKLERAMTPGFRTVRSFRRRTHLAIAGALLAGLAVPVSGFGGSAAGPPRDVPWAPAGVVAKAAAFKSSTGREVSLWTWRTTAGERCAGLHFATQAQAAAPTKLNGGGTCEIGAPRPQKQPIEANVSWVRVGDGVATFVDGRVAPGVGSSLELASPGAGAQAIGLDGRYFVLELPTGASRAIGTLEAGPYELVAYNSAGQETARLDLNELVRAATPAS